MSKTLIIDGNSLGYKYQQMAKLTANGVEIQAVFGMTKGIRNLRAVRPDSDMIVLWDGHAQWRYDMLPPTADHPGYKGDRDKDPKQALMRARYKAQRPTIQRSLQALGVRQLSASTHEADDLAGYIVANSKPGSEIELVTGDTDWLQLVRPGVTWYDPVNERTVTMDNFLDFTGYYSGREYLQGKALQGDTSDKIPGVGGIGEKGAALLLAEHKNVAEFFRKVESGEFVPQGKKLAEFATRKGKLAFARNYKLMNLLGVPKPEKENISSTRGELDVEAFRSLCEELNFLSILRDFDNFIKPFRK